MTSDVIEAMALQPCPNPWCEWQERMDAEPGADYRPQVTYSNFGMCYVACTCCSMAGPTKQHEIDAIAAWNTRAATAHMVPKAVSEDVEGLAQDRHAYGTALLSTDGNTAADDVFRDCGAMFVKDAATLHALSSENAELEATVNELRMKAITADCEWQELAEQKADLERQLGEMREALRRIAEGFGHCGVCGAPCEGVTLCNCLHAFWEEDDPQEVARAQLARKEG